MPTLNFSYDSIKKNQESKQKKLMSMIAPTLAFNTSEDAKLDVVETAANNIRVIQSFYKRTNRYKTFSDDLTDILSNTSFATCKLVFAISKSLTINSNVIDINEIDNDYVKSLIANKNIHRHLDELVKLNILFKTNRNGIYVVNHNHMFKGNYSEFICAYIDLYKGQIVPVDDKGRIILYKEINYGK